MDDDGAFWEIASGLEGEEATTRALDELAARRPSFAELLRRLPAGEVVTLVTVDGASLRGRVLEVGTDVVRMGEVTDATGTARRRYVRGHDVRFEAVIRLVWEPGA
jgi:hypothetical protein